MTASRGAERGRVILRILVVPSCLVGGSIGALVGYAMVRWLDARRQRTDWDHDTEWLSRLGGTAALS